MLQPNKGFTQNEVAILNTDSNVKNIIDETDEWYYQDQTFTTNSHLKQIRNGGVKHLKNYFEVGSDDKESYKFGRAFHCYMLEREQYDENYFWVDDFKICKEIGGARPKATNKYKEWLEVVEKENEGKTMIDYFDHVRIAQMSEALYAIPQFVELMNNSVSEVIYKGNINGVPVKCKVDRIRPNDFLLDLKTMNEPALPGNVVYTLKKYGYDQQFAFYKDITKVETVYMIAIETKYPYTVGIYVVSDETIDIGRDKYKNDLGIFDKYFIKNQKLIDSVYYQGLI